MTSSNSFFKNSFLTMGRQIFGILIGLGTSIIIADYLGPKGQGSYSLIILLPTLLFTFLNLGVNVSSVYYTGKKLVDINTLFKTNVVSGIGLSALAYIVGTLVVIFYSKQFFANIPSEILLLMLMILPVLFLNQILQSIFQGVQDFGSYNIILIAGKGSILIFAVISLMIFQWGIFGALVSYTIGQLTTLIMITLLLKKKLNVRFKSGKFSISYFKKSILYGVKTHLSNVLAFLNYRADMFVISYFLDSAAIGFYAVAVSMAEKLWVFSQSISLVLLPRISSSTDDLDKNRITSIISRNVFAASVFAGIILYLLSGILIHLMYPSYGRSVLALRLMVPGIVFGGMGKILSNDISGRGKPEINMYTSVFTVIANIVLNIIMVPFYGIYGAALATSITYTASWLIKVIIFKKITGQTYKSFLMLHSSDFRFYLRLYRRLRSNS